MSVRGTHVPEHLRLPIAGVTPPPTEKEGQRLFPTGNFRFFRPVYRDKTPPCNHACPTGEQIQKYLDHVKHDRYLDGYLTILEDNPMPSVTGRVCYHPCETACNRAAHDEPIGIRGVERFLGDFGLKLADNPIKNSLPPLNGKTVAIVGSGPGGLGCAYHLRRQGYASVIFEALDQPGGMLRAGIPAWHLPGEILDAEIAKLLDLGGIEIRCGVRVGDDPDGVTLDHLRTTYDAVFRYNASHDQEIRLIVPATEQGAGFMAAGYSRSSGRVGSRASSTSIPHHVRLPCRPASFDRDGRRCVQRAVRSWRRDRDRSDARALAWLRGARGDGDVAGRNRGDRGVCHHCPGVLRKRRRR